MKPEQTQLLRSLGSGILPVDLGEPTTAVGDRFGDMLNSAIAGRAQSDLGFTLGPSVSGTFNMQQRLYIAHAIDLATAAGSERALILHDTHALRVDVRNRVVSNAPELQTDQIVTGIDSVVIAQTTETDEQSEDSQMAPAKPILPARGVRNASLVRTLAQSGAVHHS